MTDRPPHRITAFDNGNWEPAISTWLHTHGAPTYLLEDGPVVKAWKAALITMNLDPEKIAQAAMQEMKR